MPEPISTALIVSVLSAGAAAAGKGVISQAAKDAYEGLKKMIQAKSDPAVGASLQILEAKPESTDTQEVVETVLQTAGVDKDHEIRSQVETLRVLLEKENLLSNNLYQAKVEGSGAIAQGTGAVAAGAGGIAVGGSIHGNVNTGNAEKGKV